MSNRKYNIKCINCKYYSKSNNSGGKKKHSACLKFNKKSTQPNQKIKCKDFEIKFIDGLNVIHH